MSSLYEDELNRLIKERNSQIKILEDRGIKGNAVNLLKHDIELLKGELNHFKKAFERFRVNEVQVSHNLESST